MSATASKIRNIRCKYCHKEGCRCALLSPISLLFSCLLLSAELVKITSETMQYEIDRDSSILEQILPDSEEKLELVEGIPKKDDEK